MKKGDFLVLSAVVLAVVFAVVLVERRPSETGKTAVISVDDEEICRLPLAENTVYSLPHNTVTVQNGTVSVSRADCRNQICVHHRPISKTGETIVCLPNRVIVEIE